MAEMQTVHPLDQFFANLKTPSGAGVSVESIEGRGILQVFAAKGKNTAVERALKIKQSPGKSTISTGYTAISVSPGQWLLISGKEKPEGAFAEEIKGKLKKNGYVSEQSGSRVIFRLTGPRVVELMQKGCRLDLHPSSTGKGWCAQTQMAQIGTIIHQFDDKPNYDILAYSGFARDFAEWLEHTGAQLGIAFKR